MNKPPIGERDNNYSILPSGENNDDRLPAAAAAGLLLLNALALAVQGGCKRCHSCTLEILLT